MNYRRYYFPGASVFLTQVVHGRAPIFARAEHVALLRSTLHEVQRLHPFSMLAYVFLPDHFHLLIQPAPPSTFTAIMHSLKPNFTKALKQNMGITDRLALWQPRFWDHLTRDDADFAAHLDYIHFNPVKHGLAASPKEWAASSFESWRERGAYDDLWGKVEPESLGRGNWAGAE